MGAQTLPCGSLNILPHKFVTFEQITISNQLTKGVIFLKYFHLRIRVFMLTYQNPVKQMKRQLPVRDKLTRTISS